MKQLQVKRKRRAKKVMSKNFSKIHEKNEDKTINNPNKSDLGEFFGEENLANHSNIENKNNFLQNQQKNSEKIDKKSTGFFSVGWYTDGTDEYLFKREEELNAYRELFYSRVLKQLGLLVAEYDLAILDNQKGIISKNYNI